MNDDFLTDGKADGVITEGSPEAIGVLRAANDATFAELDDAARMSSRTVANIVDRRDGADNVDGTGRRSAIHHAGAARRGPLTSVPRSLDQLLAYARVRSWIPPVDIRSRRAAARARVSDRRRPRDEGRAPRARSTATCDAFGACTAWQSAGADVPLTIDPYSPPLSHVDPARNAWLYQFTSHRLASTSSIYEEIEVFLNLQQLLADAQRLRVARRERPDARGWMHSRRPRPTRAAGTPTGATATHPVRPASVQLGSSLPRDHRRRAAAHRSGRQVRNVVRLTW